MRDSLGSRGFVTRPFLAVAMILSVMALHLSAQGSTVVRAGQFGRIHRNGKWFVGVFEYTSDPHAPNAQSEIRSCLALNVEPFGYGPWSMVIESSDSLEIFVPRSRIVVAPGPGAGTWVPVPMVDRKRITCS